MTCLISPPNPRPFIPELPEALSLGFLVSKLPGAEKLISAGNGKPGELPVMRMGPWGAAALFATAASAAYELLNPKNVVVDSDDAMPDGHYALPTDPATGRLTGLPTYTEAGTSVTVVSGLRIPEDVTSDRAVAIPGFADFLQEMMQETETNYETREYWQSLTEDFKATPQQQLDILAVVNRIALAAAWIPRQWPGNFWYLTLSLFTVAAKHGFDPITRVARQQDPTGELTHDWIDGHVESWFSSKLVKAFQTNTEWSPVMKEEPYLDILQEMIHMHAHSGDPVARYSLIAGDLRPAAAALKAAIEDPATYGAQSDDLRLLLRMGLQDPQMQVALLYWAAGMPGAPLDEPARRATLHAAAMVVRELRGRGVSIYGDVLGLSPQQVDVLRDIAAAGDRVFITRNTFEILKPGPQSDLDAAEVLAMILSQKQWLHSFDRGAFVRTVADVPGERLRDLVRELLTPEISRTQAEGVLDRTCLEEGVDWLDCARKEQSSKVNVDVLPNRYHIWASAWGSFLDGKQQIDLNSTVLQALGNDYKRNMSFRAATDALIDRLKGERKMFFHLPIAAQIYRVQVEFMDEDPARAWPDFLSTAFSVLRNVGGRKAGGIQDILGKAEAENLSKLLAVHLTPVEVRALFATALDNAIRDSDAREVRIAHLIFKHAPADVIFWEDFQEDLHALLNPSHPRMIAQTWELVKDMGAENKVDNEVWLRVREAARASFPKMKTVVDINTLKIVVPPRVSKVQAPAYFDRGLRELGIQMDPFKLDEAWGLFLQLVDKESPPSGEWVATALKAVRYVQSEGSSFLALRRLLRDEKAAIEVAAEVAAKAAAELTAPSTVGKTPRAFVTLLESNDLQDRLRVIREMGIGKSPESGRHWRVLRERVLGHISEKMLSEYLGSAKGAETTPGSRDEVISGLWALIQQRKLDRWTLQWLSHVVSRAQGLSDSGAFFVSGLRWQLRAVENLSPFPRHVVISRALVRRMKEVSH
jgi:hypothetical protein